MIPKEYDKYEKMVTISAVNFNPTWGDPAANLKKIKTTVSLASKLGANIIAFGELALSGYECGEEARSEEKPCAMHTEVAETIPGPSTIEIAKVAKDLGVYVLIGMTERDEKDAKVHYNSVAVSGPEGLLGRYRKLHLSLPPTYTEQFCFRRGNELPVFETKYGPIGVQICQDFWVFPELTRILWLKGSRLIFNCTASAAGPGRTEFMTHETSCRATENFVYAISANLVGKERTISFYGHSTIAGPAYPSFTNIFAQGGDREEIVTATLSFERLHYFTNLIDFKKIRNSELILDEFRKLKEH